MRQATQDHMNEVIGKKGRARQRQNRGAVACDAKVLTITQPWTDEVKKYFCGQVLVAKDMMEF